MDLPDDDVAVTKEPRVQEDLGLTVQNLTPELAERLGYEDLKGVVVTEVTPAGKAAKAGIREGDLITSAEKKSVTTVAELVKALGNDRKTVLLRIKSMRGGSRYVVLKTK